MRKNQGPHIQLDHFALGEIAGLYEQNQIYINSDYQRGNVWTHTQKIELIKSIRNGYSIGVLVLFVNDGGRYEILDGQQRLIAIRSYVEGNLDLRGTRITPYEKLERKDRIHIDDYFIYFIKLSSFDADSTEEDIVQIFLRLQEGTPLNKAEKINARHGPFKDAFRITRETHPLFKLLPGDKRFRLRLLAAEMLLLELESDFKKLRFPSLELDDFIRAMETYRDGISATKLKFYRGNLDLLYNSLNYLLSALKPREMLAFYLLVSYLRKHKADNSNLVNEVSAFAKEFLKNLNSFSIYAQKAPKGMTARVFESYKAYKFEAKVMTTADSVEKRFQMVRSEFERLKPFIEKDPDRYFDEEQKRTLYFRQKGLCGSCGRPMDFRESSGDHVVAHRKGGKTSDLDHAQLLHNRCHSKLEKARQKSKRQGGVKA